MVSGAAQVVVLGERHDDAEQICLPPAPVVQVWVQAEAQGPPLVTGVRPVPSMQKPLTCSARSEATPVQVYICGGDTKRLPNTAPSWFGKATSSPPPPMAVMLVAAETSSMLTCLPSRLDIESRQAVTRSWQP